MKDGPAGASKDRILLVIYWVAQSQELFYANCKTFAGVPISVSISLYDGEFAATVIAFFLPRPVNGITVV